ncbi:inner nuclear membrane protein Man1 [Chelonus insularis]|uniref:inner nuclear membrane protein Man1 n=1 Tax=Chelonus insularis TaxID=460826 RepID=UPI00158D2E94|nr:inner nuclear membrane protein Man1 [Chelonus insularis]
MSVDTLTDSELRFKLAEYGYPVGPVTQTTRNILVKKLKNLIETRGGSGSRHSLAARFSSDDTDDDAAPIPSRKKKTPNRRQTMANPMPPPAPAPPVATGISRSPSKRRTQSRTSEPKEVNADFEQSAQPVNSTNRSSITKTVTKKLNKFHKVSAPNDGLETGSDSDITDEPDKIYSSAKKYSTEISNAKPYNSKEKQRSTVDVEKPARISEPISRALREEKYYVPPFKTDISPIALIKDDLYKKKDDIDVILSQYEKPYLSEFTRKLSSQASLNLPPRPPSTSAILRSVRSEIKENDTNGHYSSPLKTTYTSPTSRYFSSSNDRPRDIVTRSYKSSVSNKEESRNSQNMVSMALVIVLALFFGILAIVYLGLIGKSDSAPALPMDNEIPICSQTGHNKPSVNCLLNEDVETTMQLLKKLRPILMKKAVSVSCDNNNEAPYLTDSDVKQMLKNDKVKEIEIMSDLHNAQLLIFQNPSWGISLIAIEDSNDISNSVLDSMEKVFEYRLAEKVGMVMLNPDLPLKCLIKQKLFAVLSTILILAAGLLVIFGGHKLFQWYVKHKKSAEREVFQLVSEIISMVELHHQSATSTSPGGSQDPYLAINHVRDNLIPPKDRKKMLGVWDRAVKFLDENESRIRREVQQVAGEEFQVWRWLPNVNTSSSASPTSKKTKVWQGQAFETMEGSVNSLTCSPTPCLKIRHMFDPDVEIEDDWEVKVQDAILEKCGEGVKILHIRVDRNSREGCVYMKCMSQEDAGKAYRALHGCWFDGHLVTVKYLRLERYHERFPDAVRCTIPLKPSNNQRLSMQAHYWQSPMEAN